MFLVLVVHNFGKQRGMTNPLNNGILPRSFPGLKTVESPFSRPESLVYNKPAANPYLCGPIQNPALV
jgi:hypothetical protein